MKTLTIFFACLMTGVFSMSGYAQEHPSNNTSEHPMDGSDSLAMIKKFSKEVKQYIDNQSSKNNGFFIVKDEEENKTLKLKLIKIHEDKLTSLASGEYFVCSDFKGTDGNTYDIDIFLKKNSWDELTATQTKVHKVNGKPRYTWYEDKGVWKTKDINK